MSETPNIQWFPGHMAKTRRLMKESMPLVDLVVELLDARIPRASANPELRSLIGQKPRMVLLNKADSANEAVTKEWCDFYRSRGIHVLAADCRSGKGLNSFEATARAALTDLLERRAQKGMQGAPVRMMIVGIPNVGKSSLINRLAKTKRAKVEDRPGVTRGRQWVTLSAGMDLLDMPGVLWPKFSDQRTAEHLAFVGSVKDDVLDREGLAARLCEVLAASYPHMLCARYKLDESLLAQGDGFFLLEEIGRRRGMLMPGSVVDLQRAAIMVLDEFRGGAVGRISLEKPAGKAAGTPFEKPREGKA